MSYPGYLSLSRQLEEHAVFTDNTLLAIWIKILFKANYKDKKWFDGSKFITIKRGSFIMGQDDLAEYLGLPRTTAMRKLQILCNDEMLDIKTDRKHTTVTVCNYNKWNPLEEETGQQSGFEMDSRRTADGQQVDTRELKELKELKKINKYNGQIKEIIEDLNLVTGKSFKHTTHETVSHISARLNEGHTVDEFKQVHRIKARQWLHDQKMSKFLRPNTLYLPSKFESYLNEKNTPKTAAERLLELEGENHEDDKRD
jgi:uncharacterized phage protein (TIGR02220 family)